MPLTRYPHGFANGLSLMGGFIPLTTRPGRTYFVDTVNGNNGRPGTSPDSARATIQSALDSVVDGQGDVIYVFPGQYAETLDINKRDVAIIGVSGRHGGRTQIIGDGATARATIRVTEAFTRGFVLANVEVDTNGLARPGIHIQNDNTGTLSATSNFAWWKLINVRVNSGNATLPSAALYLEGALEGLVYDCMFSDCTIGVALSGNVNIGLVDIQFYNTHFQNNVTADIATVNFGVTTAFTVPSNPQMLQDVQFYGNRYYDRGGTPVTNYVNVVGTATNCGDYDFYAARDVADATLMLLPIDWIAIGNSAAAAEFIIGA